YAFASATETGSTAGGAVISRPMATPSFCEESFKRERMRSEGGRSHPSAYNPRNCGPSREMFRDVGQKARDWCEELLAELQQFDRIEVLHAAADTLRRVEKHVRLGAVGIAQHAD